MGAREHLEASKAYVTQLISRASVKGDREIGTFLLARAVNGRDGIAEAFRLLVEFLKGWSSTALSAGANFPLRAGSVDLLVVDEASQCSIPHIIPLLYRAKRVVAIGDAQQLTHITRLTAGEERAAATQCGLNSEQLKSAKLTYSRHSLFDCLSARTNDKYLLDEHYRSHPQIIELSNRQFYGGQLSVLTDPATLVECGPNAVAWRDVAGRAERPPNGSALNILEAQAVVREVVSLVTLHPDKSIGVVTPFSAQARAIQRLIEGSISVDARTSTSLLVGTAHSFQGDERDIMVFSPVVSAELPSRTLQWLEGTPNLFNVAVTRARSHLLVVGHLAYCLGLQGPLGELARYAQELQADKIVAATGEAGRLHSEAEAMLLTALLKAGLKVECKQVVKGYECDFTVRGAKSIVNIECDGRHHVNNLGRLRLQDVARDALIRHQGWQVVRIPAWRCLAEPEIVASEVARVIQED